MPARKPTVAQVVADAEAAGLKLAQLDRQLQAEIDRIDLLAFREQRPFTTQEIVELQQLRATQRECREDMIILAFVNATRLDDTVEVQRLSQQMRLVNLGLKDNLEHLRALERFATIAAQVADFLAKATERLAAFAAKAA